MVPARCRLLRCETALLDQQELPRSRVGAFPDQSPTGRDGPGRHEPEVGPRRRDDGNVGIRPRSEITSRWRLREFVWGESLSSGKLRRQPTAGRDKPCRAWYGGCGIFWPEG